MEISEIVHRVNIANRHRFSGHELEFRFHMNLANTKVHTQHGHGYINTVSSGYVPKVLERKPGSGPLCIISCIGEIGLVERTSGRFISLATVGSNSINFTSYGKEFKKTKNLMLKLIVKEFESASSLECTGAYGQFNMQSKPVFQVVQNGKTFNCSMESIHRVTPPFTVEKFVQEWSFSYDRPNPNCFETSIDAGGFIEQLKKKWHPHGIPNQQ